MCTRSRIPQAAQTVLGLNLKRTCSCDNSASSILGVLNKKHPGKTVFKTKINTHTRLMALFLGLPGWAGTRKVKPIWILLKQEKVSGSGISWAICKSASQSRQTTMPVPHDSRFYRPDALPAAQLTASKHWRQNTKSHHWKWFSPIRIKVRIKNGLAIYYYKSHKQSLHSLNV